MALKIILFWLLNNSSGIGLAAVSFDLMNAHQKGHFENAYTMNNFILEPDFKSALSNIFSAQYFYQNNLFMLGTGVLIFLLTILLFRSRIKDVKKQNKLLEKKIEEGNSIKSALKKSKEKLSFLTKATTDGVWEWQVESDSVIWSQQLYATLGYDETAALNSNFMEDIVHPDDWHIQLEAMKDHVSNGSKYDVEVRVQHADGHYIWMKSKGTSLKSGDRVTTVLGTIIDITERKDAEIKLQKSSRLQIILDKTSEISKTGTWELNLVTNKLSWSDVTKQIHEVDRDYEPDLKTALNYYAEGTSRDTISQVVQEAITSGRQFDVELEIRTAKNNSKWVRAIGLLEKKNGTTVLLGLFQDLTEKKGSDKMILQHESEIKNHLSELEHYHNTVPVGVALIDSEFRWVRINKTLADINGFTVEEHLGKKVEELVPKIAQYIIPLFQSVFDTGKPSLNHEIHGITKNDPETEHDWLLHIYPYTSLDGKVTGVTAIVQEISEFKKVQVALQESEEKYRSIFENTADNIFTIDRDGRIEEINHTAPGLAREDVIGQLILDLQPGEEGKKAAGKAIKGAIVHRKRSTYETHYFNGDINIYYSTSISPIVINDYVTGATLISRDITDQKKIEIAEKKHQMEMEGYLAELEHYHNNIPVGIAFIDREFRYVRINEALADINGFTVEEHLGKKIEEILPEISQWAMALFQTVLETGKSSVSHEISAATAKEPNTEKVWLCDFYPYTSMDGKITGVTSIVQEITALKTAQEALTLSEKKYKQLLEVAHEGIWVIDKESITTFVNPAMKRILGYEEKEMIGRSIFNFMDERGKTLAEKNVERRKSGIKESHDFELINKNGERVIVAMETGPIVDEDGNYQGAIAGLMDITSRRRMEDELRASQQQFQTLAKTSPVGIFQTDVNGDCLYVNPKWEELSGMGFEEAAGSGWSKALHEEDVEKVTTGWQKLSEDNTPFKCEYRFKRNDGTIYWLFGEASAILGDDGILYGFVGTITDITEMKRIETELKDSQELFNSLSKASPVGVFLSDAQGNNIYVNQKIEEMTGLSSEESKGSGWTNALHPDDKQLVYDYWMAYHKSGVAFNLEFRFMRSDGRVTWVMACSEVSKDSKGNTIGYIGTATDITERKITQDELLESRQMYKSVFDTNLYGIAVTNQKFNFISVNPAFCELLGYPLSEIMNMGIPDVSTPEATNLSKQMIEKLVSRELEEFTISKKYRKKDGSVLSANTSVKGLYDENGNFTSCVATLKDITREKETELALKKSEKRFRALFESAPVAHYSVNTSGVITDANKKGCELIGYNVEDLIGREVISLYANTPNGKEKATRALTRFMGGEEIKNEELEILHSNGTRLWVNLTANHLVSEDGVIIGSQSSLTDITARKKIENERTGLIAELEVKNAEMERFTYTVSHDLKSPLITMKGFLGMLEKDIENNNTENIKSDINFITSGADKMDNLLHQLLELSRAGNISGQYSMHSIEEIMNLAFDNVNGQMNASKLEIKTNNLKTEIYCDKDRMVEVFQNLIDNAIKFMGDQKKPLIEIGSSKEGAEVLIYIKDNGIGLDSKYQDKIFQLFERLDVSVDGTGVGLALVKRIVESNGGTVRAESDGKNKGTTFYLSFPVRQMEELTLQE